MLQALSSLLEAIGNLWSNPMPDIPYVSCFPILGFQLEKWSNNFCSDTLRTMFDAAEEAGVSWCSIAGSPLIYLRDPVQIRHVFVLNSEFVSRCGQGTKGPFGTGKRIIRDALITAGNDTTARRWHADMLKGFHHSDTMKRFHPKLVSIGKSHVQKILQETSGDDLQSVLRDYATDVVWCLALGLDNASKYTTEWGEPFAQYVKIASSTSYPFYHAIKNFISGRDFADPDPLEDTLHHRIEECVVRLLTTHSALLNPETTQSPEEMNFLQRISSETNGTKSQPITPDVLAHARQIFSHGVAAPTLLLVWALKELSLHLEVTKKLRMEIQESHWGDSQDPNVLSHLPYLDSVINEVLRLHPPISTTSRSIDHTMSLHSLDGTELTRLPTGSCVVVSLDLLHKDPQLWGEEASQFIPARWGGLHRNALEGEFKYLPFLTGPRGCPCTRFVLYQAKVFLAILLLEAELDVTNASLVPKHLGPLSEPMIPLPYTVRSIR